MADNHPIDLGIDGLQQAREVGVGGFATVYRADQPAFRRTVAVKVLATPNLDRASRERFERECQAMGALADHPHIVTIYGSGYTRQGRPYLVMAFLPGGSLQDRIDTQGPVSWQEATLYAVHLAGALETAHRAGIIHRDIKPGNVLLSAYGEAQLTDFGIARISGGHETQSGLITASMAHAPPEVLDGHRPTVAADVYALGSTTFELMYGRPAFASPGDESMVPMLRRILTEPPPDLRTLGVPEPVVRAVERAMAKSPEGRPGSAADLGRELQAARRALGVDPGRLTIPSEVSGGRPVTLVSVAPPSPAPAPVRPPAPAPAPPAGATGSGSARPLAPPPAEHSHRPPPPRPNGTSGLAPGKDPYVPSFDGLAPLPKKRRGGRTVVLGLAGVMAVTVGVAAVLISRNASPGRGPVVTSTITSIWRGPPATSAPAADGYTQQDASDFAYGCTEVRNTPDFCTCLYTAIRGNIPYAQYQELNRSVSRGTPIEQTPVWPLATECWKQFPPAPR